MTDILLEMGDLNRERHMEGKGREDTQNMLYKPRSASGKQNPGETQEQITSYHPLKESTLPTP